MLADQIDAIVAEFTRRRVPFSHRDVAERIPDLPACALSLVRRYVHARMMRAPSYHLHLARFVGEGLTLMCIPRETAPTVSTRLEVPARVVRSIT
ncbi:MAG TPA: hypothetical protein VIK33_14425 [Anaerolineae bacterium]